MCIYIYINITGTPGAWTARNASAEATLEENREAQGEKKKSFGKKGVQQETEKAQQEKKNPQGKY